MQIKAFARWAASVCQWTMQGNLAQYNSHRRVRFCGRRPSHEIFEIPEEL